MLYFNPDVSSLGITYQLLSRRPITLVMIEGIPDPMRKVNADRGCFILSLLLFGAAGRAGADKNDADAAEYDETKSNLDSPRLNAFTLRTDYARSVIVAAMLRVKLHCRPSGKMIHAWLKLSKELRTPMVGFQRDQSWLRKEVRRTITDFLRRYAAGAEA